MTTDNGKITKPQALALLAAFLGWLFDGLDGYLYVMVAGPLVAKLMDTKPSDPAVALNSGIIQGFFLVGWALGGAVFGRIGDRLGRSRTLTLTILMYAVFTGLSYFSTRWWHLLVFRFIAALGIGGEWAAGSALVAETIHPRHKSWVSAGLQSGYMVGCIAASYTSLALTNVDPRNVFLVGILPALMTVGIRWLVPEPDEWQRTAQRQAPPPVSALFAPGLRWTTIRTMTLTAIALTTVWSFLFYAPQIVRKLPEVQGWDPVRTNSLVTSITNLFLIVNIIANFAGTYLARAVGYRRAFAIMLTGAMLTFLLGYSRPLTLDNVRLIFCLTAFFSLGLFGMFPLYIPPLFPTLLRTLGAGVCYNTGRLVSALGAFFSAQLAQWTGDQAVAVWWTGFIYIPAILLAFFLDEGPRQHHPPVS